MEEWKGGRSPTAPPLIVIPSEQKNKAIGFYGHRDSQVTLFKASQRRKSVLQGISIALSIRSVNLLDCDPQTNSLRYKSATC